LRVNHEGIGFDDTKEKSMIINIMFVKEIYVAYLAFLLEGREINIEYGNTLPLHPSYSTLQKGSVEKSSKTQSAPTIKIISMPISHNKKNKTNRYASNKTLIVFYWYNKKGHKFDCYHYYGACSFCGKKGHLESNF
jgi:hypothetical protein